VKKIYADEPNPLLEDSFRFEEIPEEEDPSSILMNEINASKYEVSYFNNVKFILKNKRNLKL
jgi:hypothetical protein